MADKIDGFGRPAVDMRPARSRVAATATADARASGPQRASAARDDVQITDTASRLKRIEAGLAGIPDVDQSRVQAVRSKLESGGYKVDAQRLAQKLLRYDSELA